MGTRENGFKQVLRIPITFPDIREAVQGAKSCDRLRTSYSVRIGTRRNLFRSLSILSRTNKISIQIVISDRNEPAHLKKIQTAFLPDRSFFNVCKERKRVIKLHGNFMQNTWIWQQNVVYSHFHQPYKIYRHVK